MALPTCKALQPALIFCPFLLRLGVHRNLPPASKPPPPPLSYKESPPLLSLSSEPRPLSYAWSLLCGPPQTGTPRWLRLLPAPPTGGAPAAAPLRSGPVTSLPRFSSRLTLPLSSSPRAVRSKDVNFLTQSSLDNFSRSRSRECDSVCIFYLLRDASSLVPTSRSW